jgi:hypothetical protein
LYCTNDLQHHFGTVDRWVADYRLLATDQQE